MANNMVDYSVLNLDNTDNTIKGIKDSINDISSAINSFIDEMDVRIKNNYDSTYFKNLKNMCEDLDADANDCDSFFNWFDYTFTDLQKTTNDVNNKKPDIKNVNPSVDSHGSGSSGKTSEAQMRESYGSLDGVKNGEAKANGLEEYYPNSNLDFHTKAILAAKLAEVGFTKDEITDILNGKMSVNKVKLDNLAKSLEKMYKENPNIRQLIIDKYGIDIFNEDGTVDKDKLAYLMIIDNKNPDDNYDLSSLIRKISLNVTSGTNSYNPTSKATYSTSKYNENVITDKKDNVAKSVAASSAVAVGTGVSHVGAGSTDKVTASAKAYVLDKKSKDNDNDSLENQMASIVNGTGKLKPSSKISSIVKGSGAIPVVAGLGTTTAVGSGLGLYAKKQNDEKDDDEEEYEYNEFTRDNDKKEMNEKRETKTWLSDIGVEMDSLTIKDSINDDENKIERLGSDN